MSIDVQTVIRETCLYRGGEFMVLMAMADSANTGDGRGIYPGRDLLAANARQSMRQCQENIKRLRADGVVILVNDDGDDLGPDEAPTGGRGKKTEWRIDLERVQELQGFHENETGHCDFCDARRKRRAKRMRNAARKGAVSTTKDAVSNTKGAVSGAHIEPTNPIEPVEPTQRARESADADDVPKKSKTAFNDRIWPEFRRCPGFSANMSKADARRAYERLAVPVPSTGDLIEAIRRYARWLAAENAKRTAKNPHPMCHPVTWLHQRRWEGFLDSDKPAADAAAENALRLSAFIIAFGETLSKKLIAECGAAWCAQWLADCEFSRGPPPTLAVAREFQRNWLATQAVAKLRRVLGADLVIEMKRAEQAT